MPSRPADEEDELLRAVVLQNAQSILLARQRAEQALVTANEALERKTDELAHSLSLMRATLESTTDALLVVNEHGAVTDCNDRLAQLWHLPARATGQHADARVLDLICRRFADPAEASAGFAGANASTAAETFDVVELEDGTVIERYSRIRLVNGRGVGRVWSFRDITERRRTDEERRNLLESERAARTAAERLSEMKDQFLANLSHELRTPLSAIVGWAYVLRRGVKSEADLHKGLDTIDRNARIQTQLIDDLLDMSRIVSGKVRLAVQPADPVSIIEAAIETVAPSADARGIRLEKVLDPAAGPVYGDPGRLQQVIWNLLSNAIKFTPKDGKVQVLLERVNSHIEITVADTGMGISGKNLHHVFERFWQADGSTTRTYTGLGLGLSIVRHLVELHGGTVAVASPGEGRGSTFTVRLPLTVVHRGGDDATRNHPRAPKFVQPEFQLMDLSGLKVLVVDDEIDARELIKRVLSDCAAEVMIAGSATEALQLLDATRPDVIISDVSMPQMDGYEFLRRVRALDEEAGGRTPAIALTAFARSEDRTRSLRAGFLVHVSKPVEPSELIATVASVTGRSGGPLV